MDRLVVWEVPLGPEPDDDAAASSPALEADLAAGGAEAAWRRYMDGMPPEWFDGMRHGPQWPLFAAMAPSLRADAEALAWTGSAPHAALFGAVSAPTTALTGASAFAFMATAADAIAAAVPDGRRAEVGGGDGHTWDPPDLADAIAAALA